MSRTTDISARLRVAIYMGATLCAVAIVWLLPRDGGLTAWSLAAALAVTALGLEAGNMRLSRNVTVSVADLPLFASVLLLDPGLAMLVGAVVGAIPPGRAGMVSRALNASCAATAAGVSAGAFALFRGILGVTTPQSGIWLWLAAGMIALALYPPVQYAIMGIWTWRAYGTPFFTWIAESVVPLLWADPISVAIVTPLAAIAQFLPPSAVGVVLLPIVAAVAGMWILVGIMQRQVETREIKDEFFRAIFVSLARLLEMKDPDTAKHSARVAMYSRELAAHIGLSLEDQSRIHLAGLLHDVGKVGVPDEILLKEGRLTDDERAIMQRHSRLSAEAIAGIPGFSDLTRMVYAHHERIDGSGYPEGIRGSELPIGARILGVADTFEALTSDRPYRPGRSAREALDVFYEDIRLFDPTIVQALAEIVSLGAAEQRAGELVDFSEQWSQAARYLDVKLDEEPFQVPPEKPLPEAVGLSNQPEAPSIGSSESQSTSEVAIPGDTLA